MKKYAVLMILVLLVLLAGCGGGGGSATLTPTGSTIRQLQPGDQVTYNLTGTISGNGVNTPVSGTAIFTVYSDTANPEFGGRRLKTITEITLSGNGNTYIGGATILSEQTSDGTIYDLGTSDNPAVAYNGYPTEYKSPFVAGDSYSYTLTYSDTTSDNNSTSVIALESVNGQAAYKLHCTTQDGSDTASSDEWFVPDWGYSAKSTFAMMVSSNSQQYYFSGTGIIASKTLR